jgi:hypothetical protein
MLRELSRNGPFSQFGDYGRPPFYVRGLNGNSLATLQRIRFVALEDIVRIENGKKELGRKWSITPDGETALAAAEEIWATGRTRSY